MLAISISGHHSSLRENSASHGRRAIISSGFTDGELEAGVEEISAAASGAAELVFDEQMVFLLATKPDKEESGRVLRELQAEAAAAGRTVFGGAAEPAVEGVEGGTDSGGGSL